MTADKIATIFELSLIVLFLLSAILVLKFQKKEKILPDYFRISNRTLFSLVILFLALRIYLLIENLLR